MNPAAKWNDEHHSLIIVLSGHLCSSGPTCLLIDRVRAPIFFVGVIGRLRGNNRSERRSTRTFDSIRLLGFVPAADPFRWRSLASPCDRSCLGLCLLQGCRARQCVLRVRARPHITSSASDDRISRSSIRSWALGVLPG